MRAADTNVLVRVVTRDDPGQLASAETFLGKGAWVSHLALAELIWVLESVYGLGPHQIAVAVDMLLAHEHLTIQDPDVVEAALRAFRSTAVGFTDCLLLATARKAGHLPLGTFDRRLSKLDGVELV